MLEIRVLSLDRAWLLSLLLVVYGVCPGFAAGPLLLVGQTPIDATLQSAKDDGTLQFQSADQLRNVTAKELVRWSTARSNLRSSEVLLTNGSRLVLADAWSGQKSWQLDKQAVSVTTKLFGKISLPRDRVRAIVLHVSSSLQQRTLFLDQLLNKAHPVDHLRLIRGDQWEGELLFLTEKADSSRQISFLLDSAVSPLTVPEDRVAAIVLGLAGQRSSGSGKWIVGTRDGSLLVADSLVTDDKRLRIRLAGGQELIGTDSHVVVHLRSQVVSSVYLSDLMVADYRQVPYLEIPWKYRRNRNVQGGPLQAGGRIYAKGLGLHTAARLTYRLDTKEIAGRYQRFVTTLAVDDVAEQQGSVIFRVYLEQEGRWQQAYASPIIRGGDAPVPVSIELGQAKQIALVTDFADRGDQRDYANWLEARLE